jgi:drug/metabolite transporter (DMT)-like permease
VVTALLVQRAINVVLGVLLVARVARAVPRPARRDLPSLVFVGLADVAANGVFVLASRSGLVSVVAVLASLYPVVTVLLARQLLGERLRGVQRAGTVTALGGVALLTAG